jgi:hypothetical protein
MPRPGLVFLGVVGGGLVALLVTSAADERQTAFTLGVRPAEVAAVLGPGRQACQTPVAVAERFAAVRFQVGTFFRPGPELAVSVRSARGGTALTGGRLRAGYRDNSQPIVRLGGGVAKGRRVAVCIRNIDGHRAALYGGVDAAARHSTAIANGSPLHADLMLLFLRARSRSALSLIPTIFERASLFHPGWVGPWTFWLLLALLTLGVPLLLLLAVCTPADEEDQ